ncbi:AraC family transcriptional regulator [Massilia sp. LXY-6]|uniref:AraC family transcriptional regulator n=1 Tax=Massilia sp. LXY-6 TaxID=3379823 RepID=UPI003EE3964C
MTDDSAACLSLADRYTKVTTCDLGEASSVIEKMQGPFIALQQGTSVQPDGQVRVRAASCGTIGLSTFRFGRTVEIFPQGLVGSILVTTAISGKAGLGVKGKTSYIPNGATFISQEEDSPTFLYDADTEVLKLRFDRRRFEEFCFKMVDQAPNGRLRFDSLIKRPDAGTRWTSLLRFVVATLNSAEKNGPSHLELASMEEMLMLTLLSIQPSNYHMESGRAAKVSPRQFKHAVDYIRQHLGTDIRLSDMADAASCSIRSLTRAFHLACDTTPMQYVHGLRLQRVRAGLSNAKFDDQTIADIAYHWGFRHLGEFNRKYREAFGETPSETRAGRCCISKASKYSSSPHEIPA